ncbi:MAG: hypothetical protein IBX55_17925 [Methyloprofundus sp.]|nr:hypothetical protein [Methyloprofundus sp.]
MNFNEAHYKSTQMFLSVLVFLVSLLIVVVAVRNELGLVLSGILCTTYGSVLIAIVVLLNQQGRDALLRFESSGLVEKYIGKHPVKLRIANMFRKQSVLATWGIAFIVLGALYYSLAAALI